MGARNRVGIGLSYRPARLHRLAESIPWNRFLGSIKILKYQLRIQTVYTENRWDQKTRSKRVHLYISGFISYSIIDWTVFYLTDEQATSAAAVHNG
jgi:hypothetical protein